ncbi:unnamed protein product [Rotaria sp. Silwood1]|nr:unnamed protein product [Rotaria sp. Silwood1]
MIQVQKSELSGHCAGITSVIENDLLAKRPVVIIHGSGRLATAIGNLLELTRDQTTIGTNEIKQQLEKVIVSHRTKELSDVQLQQIQFILMSENRPYLSVFRLDDNASLTDTIFLAVFKAQMHRENKETTHNNPDQRSARVKNMLDLAVLWNYVNGINDVLENKETINYDRTWDTDLFEKALMTNRPAFVDYFLRRQYDVLETKEYIEFIDRGERIPQICAALRAMILSSLLTDMDSVTTEMNNNGDEISTSDVAENEDDTANVRAAFGRKFVIEKLYANRIDHLKLKSRIAVALVAAGITRQLMSTTPEYLDQLHKFQKQSKDYEQFATACIDACYQRSERYACQLLLREIPFLGNITCMQVAISFRIKSFINSRCFNQVLNRQWFSETDELKAEIEALKRKSNQMYTTIDTMNAQSKRMIPATNWMMKAMDRVKMSSQRPPPFVFSSSSEA